MSWMNHLAVHLSQERQQPREQTCLPPNSFIYRLHPDSSVVLSSYPLQAALHTLAIKPGCGTGEVSAQLWTTT